MTAYLAQKVAGVTNFDCQLHCIWNQLNYKLVGAPIEDFLDQFIMSKNIHPNCIWHLLVTAQMKGQ